jgi:hypothetical protein
VLLGAGASKEAGISTAAELLPEIRAELASSDAASALDIVIGGLMQQQAASGRPFELNDIEVVYSTLEMLCDRDKHLIAPFVSTWSRVISDTSRASVDSQVDQVVRALESEMNRNLEQGYRGHTIGLSFGAFQEELRRLCT